MAGFLAALVLLGAGLHIMMSAPNPTERTTPAGANGTNMRSEWCMAHYPENTSKLMECFG